MSRFNYTGDEVRNKVLLRTFLFLAAKEGH